MEAVFNSIDDVCDLTLARFSLSTDGEDYYYFSEQSSLQVLRELQVDTGINVTNLFLNGIEFFKRLT